MEFQALLWILLSLMTWKGDARSELPQKQCDKYNKWSGPLPPGGLPQRGARSVLQCEHACFSWNAGGGWQNAKYKIMCTAFAWNQTDGSCRIYSNFNPDGPSKKYSTALFIANCDSDGSMNKPTQSMKALGPGIVVLVAFFCVIIGVILGIAGTFCACPNKVNGYQEWSADRKRRVPSLVPEVRTHSESQHGLPSACVGPERRVPALVPEVRTHSRSQHGLPSACVGPECGHTSHGHPSGQGGPPGPLNGEAYNVSLHLKERQSAKY